MTMHRPFRSPSRWTWLAPALAAAFIAACDDSLQGVSRQDTWGFVLVSTQKSGTGAHFAVAEGLFFKGNLSSVPNADFTGDTCADGFFSEGNNLGGVTYLDAGLSVEAILSGTTNELERTSTSEGLSYLLPTETTPFNPGDSIFVTVPGASGGFPAATIRAKTAEPFTFPTIDPPGGTETILLNWTAPDDARSAIIVSLRYQAPGTSTFNRHVLCTFQDDGLDSIPFRWHENWTTSAGERVVVATRLRTHYVAAGAANLGVISTYQVPTPPHP
ncbi:MAG TPA: hypothetical protein VF981_13745 [Gemmatimonadaceae bacterium]